MFEGKSASFSFQTDRQKDRKIRQKGRQAETDPLAKERPATAQNQGNPLRPRCVAQICFRPRRVCATWATQGRRRREKKGRILRHENGLRRKHLFKEHLGGGSGEARSFQRHLLTTSLRASVRAALDPCCWGCGRLRASGDERSRVSQAGERIGWLGGKPEQPGGARACCRGVLRMIKPRCRKGLHCEWPEKEPLSRSPIPLWAWLEHSRAYNPPLNCRADSDSLL